MKVFKAGDFVDACDYRGEWSAARVIRVTCSYFGYVRVHFIGAKEIFDETIDNRDVNRRIADLYTHTVDRRKWKIGDSVMYNYCQDKWLSVKITDVDHVNSTIQFNLSASELSKHGLSERSANIVKWQSILSDAIIPLKEPRLKRSYSEFSSTTTTTAVESAPRNVSIIKTEKLSPPSPISWLAVLLSARQVSAAHIKLCENALVRDEGFTTTKLFRALPKTGFTEYLNKIGITAKGLQMELMDLHTELQDKAPA